MIVAGNLIPFYGIAGWNWDIFSVFFLYWAENAVIGFYILLIMFCFAASKGVLTLIASLFTMAFFVVHYGMFCMGHIAIITELFSSNSDLNVTGPEDIVALFQTPTVQGFYWAVVGLVIAQGFQCYNLYQTKYSKAGSVDEIMFAPYGRIIVLHVAILGGGAIAMVLGQPVGALAVLIILKTLYDVITFNMQENGESNDSTQKDIQ